MGDIVYNSNDPEENGLLLYVKPSYHRNEGAGVRGYAEMHADFPHEKTSDQWFSESQFESYRMLGHEIMTGIIALAFHEGGHDFSEPSLSVMLNKLLNIQKLSR